MKLLLITLLTITILLILASLALAQGTPSLPGFPANPDPAPIDGGLGLLAAAGGAYAIRKLRNKFKQEEDLD